MKFCICIKYNIFFEYGDKSSCLSLSMPVSEYRESNSIVIVNCYISKLIISDKK